MFFQLIVLSRNEWMGSNNKMGKWTSSSSVLFLNTHASFPMTFWHWPKNFCINLNSANCVDQFWLQNCCWMLKHHMGNASAINNKKKQQNNQGKWQASTCKRIDPILKINSKTLKSLHQTSNLIIPFIPIIHHVRALVSRMVCNLIPRILSPGMAFKNSTQALVNF